MTLSSSGVARIAEANIRRWLEREKIDQKVETKRSPLDLGPYLSISRQCGAGGEEIAEEIAKQLGWDLIDRNILEKIAEDFDVSTQLVDHVDERHISWLTEVFEAWLEKKSFNQEKYLHDLSRLLMIAAQHGSFVVVGRGSQYILPKKTGLFVRLVASLEDRIRNLMQTESISESEASKKIARTDSQRAEFLQSNFHHDGEEAESYDLVINTSSFDRKQIIELIRFGLDHKCKLR